MQYAVEARIFNNGKIVTKVRKAENEETSRCTESRTCDIWVDVFDTEAEAEALRFANKYRKA